MLAKEIITVDIVFKMMEYLLSGYSEDKGILELKKENEKARTYKDKINFNRNFRKMFTWELNSSTRKVF